MTDPTHTGPTLPRTIAIDGPAGSGKTTVAAALSKELGYTFVDTGAFYRAVTLAGLRAGLLDQEAALIGLVRGLHLTSTPPTDSERADGRHYTMRLDGEDVTAALRTAEVEAKVSQVAAIGAVRTVLNQIFRALAAEAPRLVLVGRDIGTVVLPDAQVKVYLDASLAVRAIRRGQQTGTSDLPAVQTALANRDWTDSTREVAPLQIAPDAIYIDTDELPIEAVIAQILNAIRTWTPPATP